MQPSWEHIRTFNAVAASGSLSAAARELRLTQPTVGRHIDLLESELNVSLFVRSRDGMKLTETGANLILSAQQMDETATEFERLAAGLDQDISGTVRISANEIFGVLILPRLIGRFLDKNPDIDVELVISNEVSNLLQRDADVAIRLFRPTQNDLVARKVTNLPLGLYAHQEYLKTHPAPKSLRELHDHRFIGFDRETSLITAAKMLGESFDPADFAFRCDNILAHIQAIKGGVGIGVTHIGLAREWPDIVHILPEIQLPGLELWVACHAEVRYNNRIRRIMDFLADALRNPYTDLHDTV